MHFTFYDLTVEIVIYLFIVLIIGYVFLMLVDILWKIDYSKTFGTKLDAGFICIKIILILGIVLSAIYLTWINPITITISMQ